jgi:hypothetical protein
MFLTLGILLSLGIFLIGCDREIPGFSPTSTSTPTTTNTPTPTATITPTTTPLPPVGVFLIPPEASPEIIGEMQSLLTAWIPELGYRFQVRPMLTELDFTREDISLVVAIPPNPEIPTMISNQLDTQFLAVGIRDLEPAPNLTTIGADGDRLDHQGFVAGYISAMITTDWRVGVIGLSDSPETIAARQAFTTGAKYYCGLCLPSYPPWYEYPLYFELESGADTISWRTAADYMIQRFVETVYIVPGAGDEAMLWHLADNGVNIISGLPPIPGIEENWVVSLEFNLMETFIATWPDYTSGKADSSITIPLKLSHINPALFSPGRQRLANLVLEDVLMGFIDLGVTSVPEP